MNEERIRAFAAQAAWYHTIQLRPDVRTAGIFDHASFLDHYRFPDDLSGLSVLDIGASDGFFSFEFERRGAASVTAVDTNSYDGSLAISPSPSHSAAYERKYRSLRESNLQFADVYEACGVPPGHNFLAAHALLGSRAVFENGSIYDLPAGGRRYDLVFCGDLMEHLKNPLLALENLAGVTQKLCVISLSSVLPDSSSVHHDMKYVGNVSGGAFFHFTADAFREAVLASGFAEVEIVSRFGLPNVRLGTTNGHAIFHCTPRLSP
jgi:tRNA (mo5U34)-methyltransferase